MRMIQSKLIEFSSVGVRNTTAKRPKRLRAGLRWTCMDLLFIILIVVLVLALLGFFGRSYW